MDLEAATLPDHVSSEGNKMLLPIFAWFRSLCYCHDTKWPSPLVSGIVLTVIILLNSTFFIVRSGIYSLSLSAHFCLLRTDSVL